MRIDMRRYVYALSRIGLWRVRHRSIRRDTKNDKKTSANGIHRSDALRRRSHVFVLRRRRCLHRILALLRRVDL